MDKKRSLQRGAADLLTVAVGITILAIAAAGTSSALLYGRQALVVQEHYKVAAYLLRGELEHEAARWQIDSRYRGNPANFTNFIPIPYDLDSPNDRNGDRARTRIEITRDRVEAIDLIETGIGTDFYRVVMHADWLEAVAPGAGPTGRSTREGETKRISLATSFFIRADI